MRQQRIPAKADADTENVSYAGEYAPMIDHNNVAMLRLDAGRQELEAIRTFVQDYLASHDVDLSAAQDVVLAVNELATNAIEHGYPGHRGEIEIDMRIIGDSLLVRIRDRAPPFDPTVVPPPDLTLPLHLRPLGGMGIYLARRLTDEMTHRITPEGGNEVTLIKREILHDRQKEEEHGHDR
jgi:anti-sigma regulatory factor (Ser/Thr protein kinase)